MDWLRRAPLVRLRYHALFRDDNELSFAIDGRYLRVFAQSHGYRRFSDFSIIRDSFNIMRQGVLSKLPRKTEFSHSLCMQQIKHPQPVAGTDGTA